MPFLVFANILLRKKGLIVLVHFVNAVVWQPVLCLFLAVPCFFNILFRQFLVILICFFFLPSKNNTQIINKKIDQ